MHFKIKINEKDIKKVLKMSFVVPDKCKKIIVEKKVKESIKKSFRNKIDISFFDGKNKWYGRLDRYKNSLEINDNVSTVGVISSGEWTIYIEIFHVFEEIEIELDICFELYSDYNVYKGELHSHTDITDGKLSFLDLAKYFKEEKYDFFFISDHNSITAWSELKDVSEIKCYKGLELTTFYGHILLLGINEHINWYGKNGNFRKIKSIRKETKLKNGLMGVAHPYTNGGPLCAGCRWEKKIKPELFDFIEIWNSKIDNFKNNWEAVDFWFGCLKKDIKTFCTCGADLHRIGDLDNALSIYAMACKNEETHIVDALRKGHYYLSRRSKLNLEIQDKIFGEKLYFNKDITVRYEILNPCTDLQLFYISKTGLKELDKTEGKFTWNTDNFKDFFVFMGINRQRELEFMTNPIFLEKTDKIKDSFE